MDIRVLPKSPADLAETPLVQQTAFWSGVKRRLGWRPLSFDIELDGQALGDVLILTKDIGSGASIAYAPFGPEKLPDDELRGLYLATLSRELKPRLGTGCIFVRWELPWTSPYAHEEDRFDDDGHWLGPPETRLRELRMNWGVPEVGMRKAPSDLLPPDTMLVDLSGSEYALLERMKPKTRYNIRLSGRHGVLVREGDRADLPAWNALYAATARRKGITPHGAEYFDALFSARRNEAELKLLIAEKGGLPLAAMFISASADGATYLYGASSGEGRNHMAPYALQWEAMLRARKAGCSSYDLFGLPPRPDPDHPMYGLYAFKQGFGGTMLHRQGAWDYPYDEAAYSSWIASEATERGYRI